VTESRDHDVHTFGSFHFTMEGGQALRLSSLLTEAEVDSAIAALKRDLDTLAPKLKAELRRVGRLAITEDD